MRLVYNVYDDDYQIESKQFDNFQDALEYAKQGLITYICEEDLDCPGCEERVVWTWDSTWDDQEAIENVEQADDFFPMDEDIEISICGPADEVKSLAELVFDNAFDVDFDEPAEEIEVECPDCADEFGYDEEPAVKDLEFDDEEELEVGEPEIIEDSEDEDIEDLEDEEVELEIGKKFEDDRDDKLESEDEDQKLLQEERVDELFDLDLNVGIDGGENNDVSVLSSYKPKRGKDKLDELFDVSLNATLDGGSGNNVNVLSPLGGLGEALQEGLNNAEFAEYLQLCKEIGILGHKDLEAFMNEVGLEAGCPAQDVLQALRDYRAELGPDFKIVNESNKKELTELFGFGKKSKPKHRYLMAMFLDTSRRMYTSDVWRDILQIVEKYVDTTRSRRSYFAADILNQVEFVATEDVFKRVESEVKNFLDGLHWKRKKYFTGSSDWVSGDGEVNFDIAAAAKHLIGFARVQSNIKESVSEEVKLATNKKGDYLVAAESGKGYTVFSKDDVHLGGFDGEDDKKAIDKFNRGEFNESKKSLKESRTLTAMRASEIKRELDLNGNIYFSLLEPVDESDEDGWRGANEIMIIDAGSGYAAYYEWLDQEGDYVHTDQDPEFTCDTFEELLTEIDGVYVTVMDLDEYLNGTLDECTNTKKKLKEGYDVVELTVDEIKAALDSGELVLDAMMDEEDIDYVIIKPTSTGDYDVFFQYSDGTREQDLETELETFEDVLDFVSSYFANVIDLNESVELSENFSVNWFNIPGFELQVTNEFEDEGVKGYNIIYSKDGVDIVEIEIWEVDSPISVTKNLYRPNLMASLYDSFDGFAADLEYKVERYFTEQLTEGRQPVYSQVIFYYYDENDKENTITKTNLVPKDIRAEVEDLIRDGVTRVYVDAKINGEWEPLDKYTYDPVWTPGTPEYAARNGKDFALAESVSQEISKAYTQLNREYGVNVEELVYAPDGFMATKYPNGFPDFNGDIIYSEKYWAEFEEWLKQNNKLNRSRKSFDADLENDLTDQEFAEQLQARLQENKEKRLVEGDKINIPDYDQHQEIDSYIIVYDDGDKFDSNSHLLHRKYLKKNWEKQLFPKLDELSELEERNHGGDDGEWDCLLDVSTDNLIESERYDTIENAGKALERLINKLEDIGWPIELHKIKDDKYEIEFDFLDVSGVGTGYSIKPLLLRRKAYLELVD